MHLHLFRSTIIPFIPILFFILVINTPTSLCVDDEYYTNCSKSYKCGDIDISYPFWGEGSDDTRPYYCGYLGFNITCEDDVATITFNTTEYRVLNIEDSTQTLTVARNDYYDDYCPKYVLDTTINISLVNYGTSTSQNLIMYYNCPATIAGLTNQFTCDVNTTDAVGYYLTNNDQSNFADSLGMCDGDVRVPVSQSAIYTLTMSPSRANLQAALKGGFGLVWDANDTLCSVCTGSDGQCGRNLTTNEFACYCFDKSYPRQCLLTQTETNPVALPLGLGVGGAAIAGLFLGFLFFYVRQRKKQQVALSKSKDLSTPPSSKGLTTPTTKFSSTTPSYFSSQSTDLEKGGSTYFGVQVFSYTELEEATNNFDSARELGDGGFGTVYYGNLQDGRVVAVKRLYENNFKRVEQFMNEVEILTRLRHPNLVLLYGCTSRRSRELLLVYEYIPNGTVADHLHGKKAKSGLLTWPIRLSIAIETADALAYLHRSDIIHRDVKTNNILLDNNFQVKVADFGLSRLFPTDCTHVSTAPQGTPGYVDPEYYQCYQLTDKSDVYSFGVVLVELISSMEAVDTNRHRHDINLSNMAVSKIQNQALHELVDPSLGFETDSGVRRMTTVVAELAFRCLQHERDMRPSMVEVLETLKGIEKEEFGVSKTEVVDIRSDDVGLLKNVLPPPFSPDSVVADKWVSSSTPPSSF